MHSHTIPNQKNRVASAWVFPGNGYRKSQGGRAVLRRSWGEVHNTFKYLLLLRSHCLEAKNSGPLQGPSETNYGAAHHTARTAMFQNLCGGV